MATTEQMPGYVNTPPYATPYPQTEVEFLDAIMQNTGGYNSSGGTGGGPASGSGGFSIPLFDRQVFTYFAGTNNVRTITYSLSGATVATLTFAYLAGGAANDDLVTVVQRT